MNNVCKLNLVLFEFLGDLAHKFMTVKNYIPLLTRFPYSETPYRYMYVYEWVPFLGKNVCLCDFIYDLIDFISLEWPLILLLVGNEMWGRKAFIEWRSLQRLPLDYLCWPAHCQLDSGGFCLRQPLYCLTKAIRFNYIGERLKTKTILL